MQREKAFVISLSYSQSCMFRRINLILRGFLQKLNNKINNFFVLQLLILNKTKVLQTDKIKIRQVVNPDL